VRPATLVAVAAAALTACSGDPATAPDGVTTSTRAAAEHRLDDRLRLHQVQVLGSHNSYHLEADPAVLDAIRAVDPAQALALAYSHPPLTEQLETLGIRQIELDVYSDPQGGAYARPALPVALGVDVPDDPRMREPGFKVLHVADFDTRSSCPTLAGCLEEVDAWSRAHPGHVPIVVLIEVKDAAPGAQVLDALDAEIRSVVAASRMVTPDDVRGDHATLGDAVRADGWPLLAEVRGKLVFALDNGSLRDLYRAGRPSLEGRVLFTPSAPGEPDAAFAKLNDPIGQCTQIAAALDANMLVRTRADADTVQARTGDTTMRDAAIASGAQLVSTDYARADPELSPYAVRIPGGAPARCNPVTAPRDCAPTDVEDPDRLTAP
jgi:hypothetical protein